ncbi:MAG: DUF1738 domain-containing protein [Acidobacteria bacterium]|nr:DUF1738 domain-containing protein [Acidobacteriota bacterium]
MGKLQEKAAEYHEEFAARIIKALEAGTAPWQKPWKPGERILPHNFASGRDYRGGNALYLALNGLERGYADPRWGGYRQIQEAGGHVRKGEKGTPIMYVDFRQRRTARDEQGNPIRDEEGRPKLEWVQRDRPLVKLHHVFNVEQTEGLKLRPLQTAPGPEWEGHERAEALIKASGVRVDHVAGDRAYYSLKADRVVLPERSQFPSQDAYTHTALHELGHATGHPDRLNRPTLVEHGGFGTETYAREELRAEIAAMMTGEQLGVGHEPRHGTAYVSSWIKALENDPREIRAAAVDAQRISDWLLARERERSLGDEKGEQERPEGGAGRTPEREPERPPQPAPEVGEAPQAEQVSATAVPDRPPQAVDPARAGAAAAPGAPAMSEELKAVLRDMGAAGYRAGYEASLSRLHSDPHESARVHFPDAAGREIRFVLEQVHGDGYMRGMHDHQRGFHEEAVWKDPARVSREAILRVEPELKTALREIGAAGYDRGYGDAEAGRNKAPGWPRRSPAERGPGDGVEYLQSDAAAKAYARGFDDRFRGASRDAAAARRLQVDYVKEVTAIGEDQQAALRYGPRGSSARAAERSPHVAGDRDRDTAPSR